MRKLGAGHALSSVGLGVRLHYVALFVVCFLEGADQALIGATMKSLEESFGLTPYWLGLLAASQSFTTALAAPMWGWLSDRGKTSRRRLMAVGVLGWGSTMILTGLSAQMGLLVVARFFNGVFLASLTPLTQSWVADHVMPERRGTVFGYLQAAQGMGSAVCGAAAIGVASVRFGGVAGWRVVTFAVGVLSVLGACFVHRFMDEQDAVPDVRAGGASLANLPGMFATGFREVFASLRHHWKIPTFRIIIAQGVTGSIPWRAMMGFEPMFMLYVGFEPRALSVYALATAPVAILGGAIGGWVGDWAARRSPHHGRVWTAMFTVGAGIPCTVAMLKTLPEMVGPSLPWYIFMRYLFGLTATWSLSGVNRPILNDIVDPQRRAMIIAWDRAIEGTVAAVFGMPFLGLLAESVFGYVPTRASVGKMPPDVRLGNLRALQSSLLVIYTVPWAICFVVYAGLHWTYESDVLKLAARGVAGSELVPDVPAPTPYGRVPAMSDH